MIYYLYCMSKIKIKNKKLRNIQSKKIIQLHKSAK